MQTNVGRTDRIIRGIIGLGIIAVGIIFQSWWGLIGAIPLFTASIAWCPLYVPLGFSSRKE